MIVPTILDKKKLLNHRKLVKKIEKKCWKLEKTQENDQILGQNSKNMKKRWKKNVKNLENLHFLSKKFEKNFKKVKKSKKKSKNCEKFNIFFSNPVKNGKYTQNHDRLTILDKKKITKS